LSDFRAAKARTRGLAITPTRLGLDYRSEQEKPNFGRTLSVAPAVRNELSAAQVAAAGDHLQTARGARTEGE